MEVQSLDSEFVNFVGMMSSIRGSGGERAKLFEEEVCRFLSLRSTGGFHRVGWPRRTRRRRTELVSYLKALGFNTHVVVGREKDGGLDILWELPIGAVPHRPIVSFQCKNSSYDIEVADLSVNTGKRSFGCHRGFQSQVFTYCVVFNDYIVQAKLGKKPFPYVVLGLSDLAKRIEPVQLRYL